MAIVILINDYNYIGFSSTSVLKTSKKDDLIEEQSGQSHGPLLYNIRGISAA